MGRTLTALLSLALLLLVARTARADEVVFPDLHCKFNVPPDMEAMPQSEVEDITRRVANSRVTYSHGFRQRGSKTPYILIQAISRPLWGDPKDHLDEIRKEIPGGVVRWDPARNAVFMEYSVGAVRGVSFGFVGARKMVQLHCYTTADEHMKFRKAFEDAADTFRFDPGYTYADFTLFTPTVVGVLTGVVVGAVVMTIFAVRGRRRARPVMAATLGPTAWPSTLPSATGAVAPRPTTRPPPPPAPPVRPR